MYFHSEPKNIRAKWLFREVSRKGFTDKVVLTVSDIQGIIPRSESYHRVRSEGEDTSGYKLIKPNDFVIGLSAFEKGILMSEIEGLVSPAYVTVTPTDLVSVNSLKFFQWLFREEHMISKLGTIARGIRQGKNISYQDFGELLIPVPSDKDCIKIGNFLDSRIKNIDKAIEKIRQQISALNSKHSSLITKIVTKGVDSSASMRDTNIEWIGEIPSDWKISKIGYLAEIISKGTTPSTINRDLVNSGIRFLKAENINYDGEVYSKPEFYIDEQTDILLRRSRLMSNDILIVIAGATTGKCAVIDPKLIPANTNQAVCFIRLFDKRYARFIQTWLSNELIQEQIKQYSVQAAQPNLAMEDIRNLVCPVPPPNEVGKITDKIIQFSKAISNSKLVLENQIVGLQEYRKSLISAVVSGKINI